MLGLHMQLRDMIACEERIKAYFVGKDVGAPAPTIEDARATGAVSFLPSYMVSKLAARSFRAAGGEEWRV